MADWVMSLSAEVLANSSVALGVVGRRRNGRLRHVRAGKLWIQERRERGEVDYKKVRGDVNPGDLMTKHSAAAVRDGHVARMGLTVREGRACAGLQLSIIGRSGQHG